MSVWEWDLVETEVDTLDQFIRGEGNHGAEEVGQNSNNL